MYRDWHARTRTRPDGCSPPCSGRPTGRTPLALRRRPPTLLETREPAQLDRALAQAAGLVVELTAPDEAARRMLWERMLWEAEPTADVPVDELAREPLAGGEIRERVRRGAGRARGERRALALDDLVG